MAKKKPDQTTISDPKGANEKSAPKEGAGESVGAAEAAKAALSVRVTPRPRSSRPKLQPPSRRPSPDAPKAAATAPGLAVILDEHYLAFEHINQLVFLLMPMAQRGGGTRLERRQVDAELLEAGGDA